MNNNKNDKIMSHAREYITAKNSETLRKAKIGDLIILDTIKENGVMKLYQHIVSCVKEDRIHPMQRQRNIKRVKALYELTELELSSDDDDEGFA